MAKRKRRNPIKRRDRYLNADHYLLSDAEAGKLCKPFGGLPKHGYERLVETDEGTFWVNRTPLSRSKRGWVWCAYPARSSEKPTRMNPGKRTRRNPGKPTTEKAAYDDGYYEGSHPSQYRYGWPHDADFDKPNKLVRAWMEGYSDGEDDRRNGGMPAWAHPDREYHSDAAPGL